MSEPKSQSQRSRKWTEHRLEFALGTVPKAEDIPEGRGSFNVKLWEPGPGLEEREELDGVNLDPQRSNVVCVRLPSETTGVPLGEVHQQVSWKCNEACWSPEQQWDFRSSSPAPRNCTPLQGQVLSLSEECNHLPPPEE